MPVRFICDKCGSEAPRKKVVYEHYEGWSVGDMRVLELYYPYSCRLLCESFNYDENKKPVYGGCFHEVIREEELELYSYGYRRKKE